MVTCSECRKEHDGVEFLCKVYRAALAWQQGYDNPDYTVREIQNLHRDMLLVCRTESHRLMLDRLAKAGIAPPLEEGK